VLLDQGLPFSTAARLKAAGWDAVHVAELGMSRATDREILAFAALDQRVCITLDADFHALLAINKLAVPSVVRVRREGLDAVAMTELLLGIWDTLAPRLNAGTMVTVTKESIRFRGLPV